MARQQLDEDEALQVDYACKKVLQEYVAAEAAANAATVANVTAGNGDANENQKINYTPAQQGNPDPCERDNTTQAEQKETPEDKEPSSVKKNHNQRKEKNVSANKSEKGKRG